MDAEPTPEERASRNQARSDVDDGIGGPVGDTFRAALVEAGARLGFAPMPARGSTWVDQDWHGRRLLVDRSTYGAHGTTTGYRWISVRLSTSRLGVWADPPTRTSGRIVGVEVPLAAGPPSPTGFWRDDPQLLADLWTFTLGRLPHGDPDERPLWVLLAAGNDFVVWHLRASVLDGPGLSAAVQLLERVAGYAEANDAALTARLGADRGAVAHRRLELQLALGAIAVVVVITALILVVAVS
jgi:hypothetical protein